MKTQAVKTAWRRRSVALALTVMAGSALATPIALAPQHAGQFQAGNGVDATFLKVDSSWRGSAVLYDPVTDQLGSGQPVGSFPRGSGIWGLADWRIAHHAPTAGMIEGSWSGRVSQIAFGDDVYNATHGATWGAAELAPLFTGPTALPDQENWTSRFNGYIRISEAGLYNFGVLHDDGFFFDLIGANGTKLSLSNDFLNPPDRKGFADGLQLDVGLYSFELGAYEHLEAGVVELSWMREGGEWSRVPGSHLVSASEISAVPEPGSWALALSGLILMGAFKTKRRLPQL